MGNTYNTGEPKGGFNTARSGTSGISESSSQHFRYYPKEIRQQRVANQFFRSTSMQLYFKPQDGSPAPKKARMVDKSFISLPSCPEFQIPESNTFRPIMSIPTDVVEEEQTPRAEMPENDEFCCCETPVPDDDKQNNRQQTTVGPITTAVLNKGLTARWRSFSSWLLNDTKRDYSWPRFSSPFKTPRNLGGSLNFSVPNIDSIRRRKRKLDTTASVSSDRGKF